MTGSIRRILIGTAIASLLGAASTAQAQTGSPAFRVPLGAGQSSSSAPPVYAWLESVSECSSSCGPGTRTTSYQCQNAADFDYSGAGYGAPEADSLCTAAIGAKPASSNSSCTNYSGCGYDWVKPPVQQTPVRIDPNPIGRVGCGQVRSVFAPFCQRTGGGSPVVLPSTDHRFCRNDLPDYNDVAAGIPDALGYDRTLPQTTACNTTDHEWRTGNWGSFDNSCSNTATQTRSVTCWRRFDNSSALDSACEGSTKPASSQTQGVYTSCTFDWVGGGTADWSSWNDTCSTTATRTRNPQCRRSNGDIVADSQCIDKGKPKPSTSETAPVYTGCTYSAGGTTTNGAWSSTCSSSASRTVTRQCIRSNGDVVASSECTSRGVSLTSTQTQAVYDTCNYVFQSGGWSDWNSHCSSSATRTRSVTCMRSDNTPLPDSECTSRGVTRPASSETAGVYDQCGYTRGAYLSSSAWSSRCSASATRTNTYQCRRADGTIVAASECTSRGVSVTEQQTAAVYDQCDYNFVAGTWSDWNSHCSSNARRTRAVWCYRSDGTMMDPDHSGCYNAGKTYPGYEQYAAVYDQCGYSRGSETSVSGWSSQCSSNATRTHYYSCRRADGATVPDAECTGRGISLTSVENGAVYSQCGYTPVQWSDWSACANDRQTSTAKCQRSDGIIVSNSECDARGQPTTRTQACSSRTEWDGLLAGYCDGNPLFSAEQGDLRGPAPDGDALMQACGRVGGTCVSYGQSTYTDYDGRNEGYYEGYVCYSGAPRPNPNDGTCFANANSSGCQGIYIRR